MKATNLWKVLSVLYIVYFVCSIVVLLMILCHAVPFTMMALECWQMPFLPVVAPLICFITSVMVPGIIPALIWGAIAAVELFVLYKAVRYVLK
ncbi:MAG: hypothetical protein II245_01095 [Bacteroidaceae bacterium]|nr:hypothetical protein [Bacteroidaceae bacterium]